MNRYINHHKPGLFLLCLCASIHLFAQSKVGTTGVPFLGISIGPRATAMGSAFTAMTSDATSIYYNPGGFVQNPQSQFYVVHTNWLVGTSLNWVGLSLKLNPVNAIGVSVTQLNYGDDEDVTTVEQPEGTGEKWGASDICASLSYSRLLTDRFSIGGSVKYIQQKIWNESATAFALDLGMLFVTEFNDMRLGMSISNFGTDIQMEGRDLLKRVDLDPETIGHNETIVSRLKTDRWPLPIFFRVGVAMDVIRTDFLQCTMALDALRPSDNTEVLNAGTEIGLMKMVFLRGGYKSLFREDSEEGLTFGAGFRLPVQNMMTIHMDYTLADFGLFDDIHMVAIGIQF
ncbi:PorV/PorQ family protein [bacterium]|nr:PorV/PorQ family protein [bacterium]